MEDIRRKCNPNVDLSKFTSNKKINIEWSCSLSLQPSLLSNFVQCLIMLDLKKNRMVTNFFKDKKIRIFFRNLYNNNNNNNNNNNVFHVRMVLYDHPKPNVELPLLPCPYYIIIKKLIVIIK